MTADVLDGALLVLLGSSMAVVVHAGAFLVLVVSVVVVLVVLVVSVAVLSQKSSP